MKMQRICSSGFHAVLKEGRRFVRSTIYKQDPEYLDPSRPLFNSEPYSLKPTSDPYGVEPVAVRGSAGMCSVVLNLDRKPHDGNHGANVAQIVRAQCQNSAIDRAGEPLEWDCCDVPSWRRAVSITTSKRATSAATASESLFASSESAAGSQHDRNPASREKKKNRLPANQARWVALCESYYTPAPLTFPSVNLLYRILRNAEVNPFQRFVLISSLRQQAFAQGLASQDLLLLAESSQLVQCVQPYALQVLKHVTDLAWLIGTYQKPLVALSNAQMNDEGGAMLVGLSNFGAVYRNARLVIDPAGRGAPLIGGLSHILGSCMPGLGAYLACLGHPIEAEDIVHFGIAKFWMPPEAIQQMESASESQLEVSERDAMELLREHALEPPPSRRLDTMFQWLPLMEFAFHTPSLEVCWTRLTMLEHLSHIRAFRRFRSEADEVPRRLKYDTLDELRKFEPLIATAIQRRKVSAWARDCKSRLVNNRSIAVQAVTLALIHRVADFRETLLQEIGIKTLREYFKFRATRYSHPILMEDESKHQLLEAFEQRSLQFALQMEMRAAARVLMQPETLEFLRVSALQQWQADPNAVNAAAQWPLYRIFETVSALRRFGFSVEEFFEPLEVPSFEFRPWRRSPISLSQHPWLRKVHPDYDPRSKLDHDPAHMREEDERWQPGFLQSAREALRKMLSDSNQTMRLLKTSNSSMNPAGARHISDSKSSDQHRRRRKGALPISVGAC